MKTVLHLRVPVTHHKMNVNPKLVPADTARPEPVREQQHFATLSFVPYRTISLSLSITGSFHIYHF